MTFAALTERARGYVIPADLARHRYRNELGRGAVVGAVEEADLQLVSDDADLQALAGGNLAVALGQPRAVLVVDAVAVIPALARDAQGPAGGDHVIDELLRDGHVGLTGHRRARAVDQREILAPVIRDRRRPRRTAARRPYESAGAQRGRGDAVRVAVHDAVGTAVGDPAKGRDLLLGEGRALRHATFISPASTRRPFPG